MSDLDIPAVLYEAIWRTLTQGEDAAYRYVVDYANKTTQPANTTLNIAWAAINALEAQLTQALGTEQTIILAKQRATELELFSRLEPDEDTTKQEDTPPPPIQTDTIELGTTFYQLTDRYLKTPDDTADLVATVTTTLESSENPTQLAVELLCAAVLIYTTQITKLVGPDQTQTLITQCIAAGLLDTAFKGDAK